MSQTNTGFTLIEMIIYIALFSSLLSGALTTAFLISQSSYPIKETATIYILKFQDDLLQTNQENKDFLGIYQHHAY